MNNKDYLVEIKVEFSRPYYYCQEWHII